MIKVKNDYFDVVQLLLEQIKRVFCEKPLFRNRAEVDNLFQLSRRQEKVLFQIIYTVPPSLKDIKNHIHDLAKFFILICLSDNLGGFIFSVTFFGLFGILTVIIKYFRLLVNRVFKRKHYSVEGIEKLTK